jgi:hypothetical protein
MVEEVTYEVKVFDLLVELRKELIESQKIRAQIIGFKITFISAAAAIIGVKLSSNGKVQQGAYLLAIPAFAAVFFDFLINSYSFSIKRIGFYIKHYIEPAMLIAYKWPDYVNRNKFYLWETFLRKFKTEQNLALTGNIGISAIIALLAIIPLIKELYGWVAIPLLIVCLVVDFWGFLEPKRRFDSDYLKLNKECAPEPGEEIGPTSNIA